MNLYAMAVAAERSAKIERDMMDHANGIEAIRLERDKLREQVELLREALNDSVSALEHRWEVVANRAAPIMESVIDAAHTKGIEALSATEQK